MILMQAIRRALGALGVAFLAAIVVRFRGTRETPTKSGVWRELRGDEFR